MTPQKAQACTVRVQAPAKLNLVLRVLEPEASGFHSIESLFVKLELADVVTLQTNTSSRSLRCSGRFMPATGLGRDEDNLAWRAAESFARVTGWPHGFAIDIDKQIPVGGGLGGGSSDAAAVLRGLNAIAPEPLTQAQLLALALELGSDVPFLASEEIFAWAWGRGQRMLGLPSPPVADVELLAFDSGVSTGAAYSALAERRGATVPPGTVYGQGAFHDWDSVAALAVNDFETVVPAMHSGVASILPRARAEAARLRAQGNAAIGLMSGSGATCFVLHGGHVRRDWYRQLESQDRDAAADGAGAGMHAISTRTASAIVAPSVIV